MHDIMPLLAKDGAGGGLPEDMVEAARLQAREILRRAAAQAREDGLREGMDAAGAECQKEAEMKAAELQEKTRRDIGRIIAEYDGRKERARSAMTEQAFRLAKRIVNSELHRDDSLFLGLVRAAAANIGKPDHLQLRTGPLGMTAARHYRVELEKLFGGSEKYEVVLAGHDDGMCVIETPEDSVDAGVETQLLRAARMVGLPEPTPEPLPGAAPAEEEE